MGKKIRVTPQELGNAAATLNQLSESYTGIYKQLMTAAGTMGEAWEGQDNLEFVNQIQGFTQELQIMAGRLRTAGETLLKQKENYSRVQESNILKVKNLTN